MKSAAAVWGSRLVGVLTKTGSTGVAWPKTRPPDRCAGAERIDGIFSGAGISHPRAPEKIQVIFSVAAVCIAGCDTQPVEPPTAQQIQAAKQQYQVSLLSQRQQQRAAEIAPRGPRDDAADALARIGRPAVPYLLPWLDDPDPSVRARTARVLGRMGPEAADAVDRLTAALVDSDPAVAQAAAYALGQIGADAEPAIPNLVRLLHAPEPALPDDSPGQVAERQDGI